MRGQLIRPLQRASTGDCQEYTGISLADSSRSRIDNQLHRQQLDRRDLQQGTVQDTSLGAETFRQATSRTAAWKKRPSGRQLQRQHLGTNHFPQGSFQDSSLKEETFNKAASKKAAWKRHFALAASQTAAWNRAAWKTAAWKTAAWTRAAWKSSLEPSTFEASSLEEETFSNRSFDSNSFQENSLRASSFQEDSLADKSFQRTASTTELAQLQRRTSTTELSELERTALTTELSQLAEPSFESLLTRASLVLSASTAQLRFEEASFSTLNGASLLTSRRRGGVLSSKLACFQLDLTELVATTFVAQASPAYLRKVLALQLITLGEAQISTKSFVHTLEFTWGRVPVLRILYYHWTNNYYIASRFSRQNQSRSR